MFDSNESSINMIKKLCQVTSAGITGFAKVLTDADLMAVDLSKKEIEQCAQTLDKLVFLATCLTEDKQN